MVAPDADSARPAGCSPDPAPASAAADASAAGAHPRRPRVVVVGAGFGGLRAVRELGRLPVDVTLVDRHNYHLFQPLLYQVATAGLSPDEIAYPVRKTLRRQENLQFRMAELQAVDWDGRHIHTSGGAIPYDYLILAFGGVTNFFGNGELAATAFGMKELPDALAVRNHVLAQFERAVQEPDPDRRRAMLTFVVVGGGPTGVECAGALSELIRLVLRRDYREIGFADLRIVLLEAGDRLLMGMPEDLAEYAADTLWDKHVEVRFGAMVRGYDGTEVRLKGGEVIPARTLIWAAGVRAPDLAGELELEQGPGGRLRVGDDLRVPGRPEAFVIGDAAYLEDAAGRGMPMLAPVAIQEAECAVANIRRDLAGAGAEPFRYKDPGSLATIGRNAAVARFGRAKFQGFLAWIMWLVVHIVQLIGFRNKLLTLINWAYDYFFYDRAVRLIIAGQEGRPGPPAEAEARAGGGPPNDRPAGPGGADADDGNCDEL